MPTTTDSGDGSAVEVGVKFTADIPGVITGISFYKGVGNTGTHIGTLWSANGTVLAQATFTNESATGWETVLFATPVPINAGTTYVASYYTAAGHYSVDHGYFNQTYNSGVLHAQGGNNGVYVYGAHAFPTNTYSNSNYWVDVLFVVPPPTVTSVTPTAGSTEEVANVSATFSEALNPTTVTAATVLLTDANGNAVPATVSYNAVTDTVTLTPSSPLAALTYTATLKGNANGPGIAAVSGAPRRPITRGRSASRRESRFGTR